jgi:holo-[acyl-carrier protein] synthase
VTVVGVGIDAVDVERFALMLARRDGLADRLFTAVEQREGNGSPSRLAARFAAKEATMKALGVGLGAFGFHDVWVERESSGRPVLRLAGRALAVAESCGAARFDVSLTHTDITAQAIVLAHGGTA